MNILKKIILASAALLACAAAAGAATPGTPRHVVILSENAGQHKPFVDAAIKWLIDESALWNMQIQVFTNANYLTDKNLIDSTDLIIQLDFPPYTWNEQAKANFIEYINEGRGAWIGFHHATLLGDFDGWPMWNWFSDFMGGISFKNYIAPLADGTVNVEAPAHPVMDGVAPSFVLADDEWYTYDRSPRPNVDVIASVDESTYSPASDIKMGDHPVVWSNPAVKAKKCLLPDGTLAPPVRLPRLLPHVPQRPRMDPLLITLNFITNP